MDRERSDRTSALRIASRLPSWHARYAVKRAALMAAAALGRRPAVTYATLRTSSTSVHAAIRAVRGFASSKAHTLAPAHHALVLDRSASPRIARSGVPYSGHVGDFAIRDQIVRRGTPADFVILARDPVAVAASLIGSFPQYWPPGLGARLHEPGFVDSTEAEDLLAGTFFGRFPRTLMLDWIRDDVPGGLGWDPLEHAFERERGWSSHIHGPWRILLLRADVGPTRASEALSAFLDVRRVEVHRGNSGRSSGLYGTVARAVARRPEWIEEVFASPFVRHFWPVAAIDALRERWTRGTA